MLKLHRSHLQFFSNTKSKGEKIAIVNGLENLKKYNFKSSNTT